MLPIYLFGNLHCLGMCGPLVMMIGQHRFRYFYFLGRLLSFSLAGLVAGEAGAVITLVLRQYQVTAYMSFIFGLFFFGLGISQWSGFQYPGYHWLAKKLARFNPVMSLLILKDQPLPSFLFGFFTLALPCGQTLLVFSACALTGDPLVGLGNGFAFALLTSPSLFFAMKAHGIFKNARRHYQTIMGIASCFVGIVAILRGLAELGVISHWILNPNSSFHYHIVIY